MAGVGRETAEMRSRRAFGDVSNSQANINAKEAANKPRRSRRLSGGDPANVEVPSVAEQPPPLEEEVTGARRRSSRLSLNAAKTTHTKSNLKDPPLPEPEKKQTARRVTRPSQPRSQAPSKQPTQSRKPNRASKRSRPIDLMEPEPARKRCRRSSRGRQKKIPALPQDPSICNNPSSDILTNTDYGLQRHPFDAYKYTEGTAMYDKENEHDAQEVSSYVTDIFQRLYDSEAQTRPTPYMDKQSELNALMRSILIDWIVEVHMKFRLLPETLYLCINIIDRYLRVVNVERKKLQLVGVTALLLACKYEEIYPPEVKDCVYITDRAYTRQDVLDTEAHIVKTLKFHLTVATGYPFLQRFLHITKVSRTTKNLANFYMERMLQEYGTLNYRPSLVAAAAVSLAINNPDTLDFEGIHEAPGMPPILLRYTGFSVQEIKEVAGLMEKKVKENTTSNSRRTLVSVRRKYESDRYDNVSSAFMFPMVRHLGIS